VCMLGVRPVPKRACGTDTPLEEAAPMARPRAERIAVIAVGTPPPLALLPLAAEVFRMLDDNQAAEREATRRRQEDRDSSGTGQVNRSPVAELPLD
jgi:hypothetical protein